MVLILAVFLTAGPQHVARDVGTGGVQSQRPAEPHQDGEGHGGAQVVHGERDPRRPPHHLTRYCARLILLSLLVLEGNSLFCFFCYSVSVSCL